MAKRSLQDELGKRGPFRSPQEEAVLNLLRTADQLQNRLGRFFRDYSLTSSQYNVLRILRGEGKALPCLEIVERMIQTVPAMTGLLDRIEQQGLVSRERCCQDRRVVYVRLTDKTVELLAEIDEPLTRLQSELMSSLNRAELKELSRLLTKARE